MQSSREKEPLLNNQSSRIQNTDNNETKTLIGWRCYLVGPIIFLHFYSYVLIMTSMQQYALSALQKMYFPNETINATDGEQSVCDQNTTTQNYKDQQMIQSLASEMTVYWTLVNNIPAIFSSLACGSYSDRFGRKPFLGIALTGTFLKAGLCALGIFLDLNIYIFIAFFGVEGITGTWISSLMACFAIGADITEPGPSRTVAIVLIEMFLGLGAVFGVLTSGYIIKYLGFQYASIVAFGVVGLGLFMTLILLPETYNKTKEYTNKRLEHLKNALRFYTQNGFSEHGKRWQYVVCLSIFMLVNMSTLGKFNTETLYVLDSPFCWNSVKLGWYGTLRSGLQSLIGIVVVKPLQSCFNDENILIMGALSNIASLILEALTKNDIVMFMVPVIGALTMIQTPVVRSIMSKMTSPDAQGALFAGIAAIEAVCNLSGSVAASGIYAATVSIFRGLVFIVLAGFNFLSVIMVVILKVGPNRSTSGATTK